MGKDANLRGIKFFIKTYGCQTNVYDSEKIALLLLELGLTEVDDENSADIVILNTCHIREKARHKVLSELGLLRPLKEHRLREGRPFLLVVCGCVAQAEGAELLGEAPFVDVILGTKAFPRVGLHVAEAWKRACSGLTRQRLRLQSQTTWPVLKGAQIVDVNFQDESHPAPIPLEAKSEGAAFVAIQKGCDKFCTYCVVPYTRGAEVSRPVDSVLEEIRNDAAKGILEVTLLGQNVNAYSGWGPDGQRWSFGRLLEAVHDIEGIRRIFYTSSHPLDVSLDVIKAHATKPKIMPYWHLPIQSGSDAILKAMNRKHTAAEYLKVVELIRTYNPGIAMASDFIVGFPGETEEDFESTLELVRAVQFAQSFSFKYSQRPGTPAADWPNQVDEDVKTRRLLVLQDLLREQQRAFNETFIGREIPVLFRRHGKKGPQILGKSPYMQSVVVDVADPELYMNSIVPVRIVSVTATCLTGVFVE